MFELLLALSDVEVMMGGNILQNLSDIYRLVASSLDAPKSVPSDVRFDGYRRAIQTAAGAAYMQLRSVDKAELWGFAARRTLRRGHFTGVGKGSP